ncbi:MAG: hypothetical protein JSV23_10925 [Promethearchaeota archaeon]|nr:MAG: hypothetical protein JSV23_10925 [Candidatus Lokiarchaeota archaeon]
MIKTTSYGLMFNVLEGGVIEPIKWNKNSFMPETSIIVLDEGSESVFLWHGIKQGLVARRTALRQAESLKGHGYTVGKSIIGRDIKNIKEIDARKIGKVPEDTKMNEELQEILDRKFTELDSFIVTFQVGIAKPIVGTKVEPKVEVKPAQAPTVSKSVVQAPAVTKTTTPAVSTDVASEYETSEPMPSIRSTGKSAPAIKVSAKDLITDAKVAFVFSAILEHYADIWISKKSDGSFAVEQMDGPICQFSIKEGAKLNFTANSFLGVDLKIKTAIQKKFIELNKLID